MEIQAELATRDDDRAAADLDPLDRVPAAVRGREEPRGTPDLDSLLHLDLRAPVDEPVPAEMTRERAGRGTRRRILGDAVRRGEHPHLPRGARAGEAVGHHSEVRERREVRPQRRDLVLRAEPDEVCRTPLS